MRSLLLSLMLLATGATRASTVTPLLSRDLAGIAGKEGVVMTVELAPGEGGTPHRHNADVFVYVLEGSIVMQVAGGAPITLHPGETFHEQPSDIHVVGRNASATATAKFIAFFVKDKGAPAVVPVH